MTLVQAFKHQSISCAALGSPFMESLLKMLAQHWPTHGRLNARLARFEGEIGPSGASLPLRIAGGLHALVLSGRAPELAQVYPPHTAADDVLRGAVLSALTKHEDFLLNWVESPPQTNDVRRSAALMPAAAVLKARFDLPVWLSELGASGGLNLMWDHFLLQLPDAQLGSKSSVLTLTPDWEGPAPPAALPDITKRAGVDLNPLDLAKPADMLRLMAYLWPDQPERLALTRAAASVMNAQMTRSDAIDWLEHQLNDAPDGQTHLIQHTIAWQYFPAQVQQRGLALIEAAGARATATRPLAWLSLESDGDTKGALGAALTLRLWPGDVTLNLGRADFHGRWVKWRGVT